MAEDYYYNSPYAFSENQVVVHVELEGLEKVYLFDQENRPQDDGTEGTSYTAEIYVVQPNGEVTGPYDGSSYPNSVDTEGDNSPAANTVDEGTHNYSNQFGHDGGTEPGLNLGQGNVTTYDQRTSPGTDPDGNAVDPSLTVINVHEGYSNNGNYNSRGSAGCVTVCPDDADAFFSNFDFSGSNENTGNASGTISIYRGNSADSEKQKRALKADKALYNALFK